MSANALSFTSFTVEEERIVPLLQEAADGLVRAQGEVVLDFSGVRRIDSRALRAMEDFARVAEEKAVKIVLRGVNVDVYKVLKLNKVAGGLCFRN
jgi:anti-anti-sigma regulatory factor